MNRPRLIRGLRIAWSAWWGILCVVLVMLWVRSYWWLDVLHSRWFDEWGLQATSTTGRMLFFTQDIRSGSPYFPVWQVKSVSDQSWIQTFFPGRPTILGFRVDQVPSSLILQLPHWFPVLVCGGLSAIFGTRQQCRFSLRTLLIAFTLVAVVLGLAVLAIRS